MFISESGSNDSLEFLNSIQFSDEKLKGRPKNTKKKTPWGTPIVAKQQPYELLEVNQKQRLMLHSLLYNGNLSFEELALKNVLEGSHKIDKSELQLDKLPEIFISKEVDLKLLKWKLSADALKYLSKVIKEKKKDYKYICSSCKQEAVHSTIQCAMCFKKYHTSCLKIRAKRGSWFCLDKCYI